MTRLILLSLLLAGCSSQPSKTYGYVTTLGTDTISVERVTYHGSSFESDAVDRFPKVRQRHAAVALKDDGSISRVDMTITTPTDSAAKRTRHVVVEVGADSVRITKTDSSGVKRLAFAVGTRMTVAHVPQMYSLYDVYFNAAARKAAVGDSVTFNQVYIDREFDRFPEHEATVHMLSANKAEIHHDWLSGFGEAVLDSAHHIVSYDGARSTYKVLVKRVDVAPDVAAIGARFASLETSSGGAKQLSVRDTTRATIGTANFWVDYGRPLARGRVLVGNILPYDRVWRTGANAATQFNTSASITVGGLKMPAGTYTLWTVPRADGRADLVVSKQFGQWGTEYDDAHDLGMAHLVTSAAAAPVEEFTISITPADAKHGTLTMEWGTFKWTAPIVVL